MSDKPYIAAELPFEERCAMARGILGGFHLSMQEILEEDLRHLEERRKRNSQITDLGTVAQKLLDDMFEGQKKLITESSQSFVAIGWNGMIDSCRRICGDDATDFALKAIEQQARKGN